MSTFLAILYCIRVGIRYSAYTRLESALARGRITVAEFERFMLMVRRVDKPLAFLCLLLGPMLLVIGKLGTRAGMRVEPSIEGEVRAGIEGESR